MLNSSTRTETGLIEPIHPGKILMEGFGITQNKLAVSIGVPPWRINGIVHGKRGITADTAIRLARYFGRSEEFWMNLQSNYQLRLQRRAPRDKVAAITPLKVSWQGVPVTRSRRPRPMSSMINGSRRSITPASRRKPPAFGRPRGGSSLASLRATLPYALAISTAVEKDTWLPEIREMLLRGPVATGPSSVLFRLGFIAIAWLG